MEHHCGIVGIHNIGDITYDIKQSMSNIQHRGYDGTGISYYNDELVIKKKPILVNDFFESFNIHNMCIGHVRYSTRKTTDITDLQPFIGYFNNEPFSLVHNGNIPNINNIQKNHDIYCDRDSDTYILVKLIEKLNYRYDKIENALTYIINTVPGSYSLCILYNKELYGLRDRFGIRPLFIGKHNTGYKIISETVGLGDYSLIREVKNGEIVKINNKLKSIYHRPNEKIFCSFELIYFMNYKSIYNKISISDYRYNLGKIMGEKELSIKNNSIVTAIPNSSLPSAKGFSKGSGIPCDELLIRRSSIKRTFILPKENDRIKACNKKFIYLKKKITGKHVYLLDDSIVRGTTTKTVVSKLKEYGALSVNVRIVSPPIMSPCYFGINMSTKKELITNNNSINDINNIIGSTSLRYIKLEDMLSVLGDKSCISCFTGNYNKELLDW